MNERNEAALQRQLEEAATDDDTRTIARLMAEMAEELDQSTAREDAPRS